MRSVPTKRNRIGPSQAAELSGYAATFLLGIYGGFFSGGYVTMLTPIFVVCFSMTFVQAVANTKLVNIFSLVGRHAHLYVVQPCGLSAWPHPRCHRVHRRNLDARIAFK